MYNGKQVTCLKYKEYQEISNVHEISKIIWYWEYTGGLGLGCYSSLEYDCQTQKWTAMFYKDGFNDQQLLSKGAIVNHISDRIVSVTSPNIDDVIELGFYYGFDNY